MELTNQCKTWTTAPSWAPEGLRESFPRGRKLLLRSSAHLPLKHVHTHTHTHHFFDHTLKRNASKMCVHIYIIALSGIKKECQLKRESSFLKYFRCLSVHTQNAMLVKQVDVSQLWHRSMHALSFLSPKMDKHHLSIIEQTPNLNAKEKIWL